MSSLSFGFIFILMIACFSANTVLSSIIRDSSKIRNHKNVSSESYYESGSTSEEIDRKKDAAKNEQRKVYNPEVVFNEEKMELVPVPSKENDTDTEENDENDIQQPIGVNKKTGDIYIKLRISAGGSCRIRSITILGVDITLKAPKGRSIDVLKDWFACILGVEPEEITVGGTTFRNKILYLRDTGMMLEEIFANLRSAFQEDQRRKANKSYLYDPNRFIPIPGLRRETEESSEVPLSSEEYSDEEGGERQTEHSP